VRHQAGFIWRWLIYGPDHHFHWHFRPWPTLTPDNTNFDRGGPSIFAPIPLGIIIDIFCPLDVRLPTPSIVGLPRWTRPSHRAGLQRRSTPVTTIAPRLQEARRNSPRTCPSRWTTAGRYLSFNRRQRCTMRGKVRAFLLLLLFRPARHVPKGLHSGQPFFT
jgi:hypothetical protein